MGGNDKIVPHPDIVLREEFDDYAFLYHPDSGDAFPLNPVGVFIWKHLDGRHTVDTLVDKIREDFEDVPDSAATHIRSFLKDLSKRGFVRHE